MPRPVRVAQFLLALPPLWFVGLCCLSDDPLRAAPWPAAVLAASVTVAVGLGRRSELCRDLAHRAGWFWVVLGTLATAGGMATLQAWGLGCAVLVFVALPLLACGLGLAAAAGSDAAKTWCRAEGVAT